MIQPDSRSMNRDRQIQGRMENCTVCGHSGDGAGDGGGAGGRGKGTLSRLFTRNSLIVLEYLITRKEDAVMPISELAKVLGISESSLISNCRKLIDEKILVEVNFRTERSWAKLIRLNLDNEIVNDLIQAFRRVVEGRTVREQPRTRALVQPQPQPRPRAQAQAHAQVQPEPALNCRYRVYPPRRRPGAPGE